MACQALTKSGSRCRLFGDPFCHLHRAAVRPPNVTAVEVLVAGIPPDVRLAAVEPLVEAARSLAVIVDRLEAAQTFDANAWREYRLAVQALRDATAVADDGDGLAAALDEMRATVGDP